MKKRMLALSLVVTCMLSMTACGLKGKETLKEQLETKTSSEANVNESSEEVDITESTEESSKVIEPTETESSEANTEVSELPAQKPAVEIPSELSDDIYSFQISIDGTVYQFPMWCSDFEALGWTYDHGDENEMISSNQHTFATWKKDGIQVSTDLANLSMNSVKMTDAMVAGISFDNYFLDYCDWEIILPGGIQYGVSTEDDIIAAYGDPTDEYEGDLYYKMTYRYDSYQDIDLFVYKESGLLEQIELRNIIELEGADNSVNPEVPEIIKGYTAPAELGDDLYQFNIELEGNLYTLPCPVSELLANGFTLGSDSAEAVGAGGFDWIELKYNNQSYRTIVHNYADYATIPENCFVTSMKTSEYSPDFELTIPCGIKRGDTEDSLLKALEGFNYEVEDSGDYKYYKICDPDGSILDSFELTIKEGAVTTIEVDNSQEPEY